MFKKQGTKPTGTIQQVGSSTEKKETPVTKVAEKIDWKDKKKDDRQTPQSR
jgi:hypothetical protein